MLTMGYLQNYNYSSHLIVHLDLIQFHLSCSRSRSHSGLGCAVVVIIKSSEIDLPIQLLMAAQTLFVTSPAN